ncbi:HAD family hydrolase [Allonocardiopsis opalescens]|uniref:Putative hydrolase of the HAD superfamily n=1 Tax=Allonocardiopsis opalescens TaxID=1144618 RepID=A0A2T0PTT5_9ACTN|nr:HAD family hydrolase [Allonocardiopsis opalescens]PRX92312.1 putative hydrolase of the HAD superfamily [Allonocardiopsis opalescens]
MAIPTHPAIIFFDLDDTLLDDTAAVAAGCRHLATTLDHPDPHALHTTWTRTSQHDFARLIAGQITPQHLRRDRARAVAAQAGRPHLTDTQADTLHDTFMDAYTAHWRPYPDVHPTLDRLTAHGHRLGIITNGPTPNQHAKLRALRIDHHFDPVICRDTYQLAKPQPAVFHRACAAAGTTPHHSIHIGDDPTADAHGAHQAGLHALLLDRHDTHPHHHTTPRIRGLDQLAALLTPDDDPLPTA